MQAKVSTFYTYEFVTNRRKLPHRPQKITFLTCLAHFAKSSFQVSCPFLRMSETEFPAFARPLSFSRYFLAAFYCGPCAQLFISLTIPVKLANSSLLMDLFRKKFLKSSYRISFQYMKGMLGNKGVVNPQCILVHLRPLHRIFLPSLFHIGLVQFLSARHS